MGGPRHPMTVADLVQVLQALPQDLLVTRQAVGDDIFDPVMVVYERTGNVWNPHTHSFDRGMNIVVVA